MKSVPRTVFAACLVTSVSAHGGADGLSTGASAILYSSGVQLPLDWDHDAWFSDRGSMKFIERPKLKYAIPAFGKGGLPLPTSERRDALPLFSVKLGITGAFAEAKSALLAVRKYVATMEQELGTTIDIELTRAEATAYGTDVLATLELTMSPRKRVGAGGVDVSLLQWPTCGKLGEIAEKWEKWIAKEHVLVGGVFTPNEDGGRGASSTSDPLGKLHSFNRVLGFVDDLKAHGSVALEFEGWQVTSTWTDGSYWNFAPAWYPRLLNSPIFNQRVDYSYEVSPGTISYAAPPPADVEAEGPRPTEATALSTTTASGAVRLRRDLSSARGAINDAIGFLYKAAGEGAFSETGRLGVAMVRVPMVRMEWDAGNAEVQSMRDGRVSWLLPEQPQQSINNSFSFEISVSGRFDSDDSTATILNHVNRVTRVFEQAGFAVPEIEAVSLEPDGAWNASLSASGCARSLQVTSQLLGQLRDVGVRVRGEHTTNEFRLVVNGNG